MATFGQLTGPRLNALIRTDDSTVLFTTGRRSSAVNLGIQKFAEFTDCYVRISSVACSCNTTEYNLLSSSILGSTDFVKLSSQGVEYHLTDSNGDLRTAAGDDFPRRDIEWLNRYSPGWRESTTVVDMPSGYYIRATGGQMVLGLPERPDVGSSETATLLVPYIARPAPITSTSERPFTDTGGNVRTDLEQYDDGIVYYAAHHLEQYRGDDQASEKWFQKFLGVVDRCKAAMRPKGPQYVTFGRHYLKDASRNRSGYGLQDGRDPFRWP